MTQNKLTRRFGAALLGVALISGTAHAAGTSAGTTVSNTFTLDYDVGGTPQPTINNTLTPTQFTVDRLVDLTVTELNSPLSVVPGSPEGDNRAIFRVTNLGNDIQAYALNVAPSGDYTPGTVTIQYFVDSVVVNGTLDAGETLLTYNGASIATQPDDIPADAQIIVYVDSSVPGTAVDGNSITLTLTADTLYPSTPVASCTVCTPGDAVIADDGTNVLTGDAETVLADGSGSGGDAPNAGDYSAVAALNVLAPTLAASKTVAVMATAPADEATCIALTGAPSTSDYSVPGACIRYEIFVDNTGAGDASNLVIADRLPAEVRFLSASLGGNFADDTNITPGVGPILTAPGAAEDCDGTTNCNIQLDDAILAGGDDGTIYIWALVQ